MVEEKSKPEEKQNWTEGKRKEKELQTPVRNCEYMHKGLPGQDKEKTGKNYLKKILA